MLEQGIDPQFPIEDYKGATIGEWVTNARTRLHIKYRFNRFLTTYLDNKGIAVYAERLKAMGEGAVNLNVHHTLALNDSYSQQGVRTDFI